MPEWLAGCNPCLCTSIRNGSLLTALFDIIYGAVYILRVNYLEWTVKTFRVFYPEPFPFENRIVAEWMKYGNYSMMMLSGLILFIGIKFMSLNRNYQACYFWLGMRLFLTCMFGFIYHEMSHSTSTIYQYYAYEVLANLIGHAYMALVVYLYSVEAEDAYRSEKTSMPIRLRAEHFQKNPYDLKPSFNDDDLTAISMYNMTPKNYLANFPSTAARPESASLIERLQTRSSDSDSSWDEAKYLKYLGQPPEISTQSAVVSISNETMESSAISSTASGATTPWGSGTTTPGVTLVKPRAPPNSEIGF